jgi:hypothetical protein
MLFEAPKKNNSQPSAAYKQQIENMEEQFILGYGNEPEWSLKLSNKSNFIR